MAFGWVRKKLSGLFGRALNDEAPTTINIKVSELFDILKPVLEEDQRKHDLISVGIDNAQQRALTIIANSRCNYSVNIEDFRNSLKKITSLVPALCSPDHVIAIPIRDIQILITSKTSITDITRSLDQQYSSIIKPSAEILPFNEDDNHLEFFAAKQYLTDEDIDSMRDSILKLDDSLSAFAIGYDIKPIPIEPSYSYEPT